MHITITTSDGNVVAHSGPSSRYRIQGAPMALTSEQSQIHEELRVSATSGLERVNVQRGHSDRFLGLEDG